MRILITGGAGFIGSHVVDAYIATGHEVFIIDNLSTGTKANLNPRATFFQADIRDSKLVREIITKIQPDVINHHAAQAAVTLSGANPAETYEINVMGTINLLLSAQNIKKFIFISTGGALYGNLTKTEPFTENAPTQPLSAYGLSKMMGESLVTFYAKEIGFSYTILRLANAYGPRQNPKGEAGICAIFSKLLSEGKQPTVYNKNATRDYVFVSDIAQANVQALTRGENKILNIGTGIETTNQLVFEAIARQYQYVGEPHYQPARMGEVERTALNASQAREVLEWTPKISFTQGIQLIHV